MEQNQNVQPWQYKPPQPPALRPFFPTGKKELLFGIGAAASRPPAI